MEHLIYCDKKAEVLEMLLDGTKTMIIRGEPMQLEHQKNMDD